MSAIDLIEQVMNGADPASVIKEGKHTDMGSAADLLADAATALEKSVGLMQKAEKELSKHKDDPTVKEFFAKVFTKQTAQSLFNLKKGVSAYAAKWS
jgi:hypothetical protein